MTSGHTKMNRMNLRISLKRQEYCTSWHSKSRNQPRWRSEQLQRGAPLLATVHRRVHLSRSCSCPTSAAKVFTHQTLLVIASCVVSLNKSWQSRSFGSGGRQSNLWFPSAHSKRGCTLLQLSMKTFTRTFSFSWCTNKSMQSSPKYS